MKKNKTIIKNINTNVRREIYDEYLTRIFIKRKSTAEGFHSNHDDYVTTEINLETHGDSRQSFI